MNPTTGDCTIEGSVHSFLDCRLPGVSSIVRHIHSALKAMAELIADEHLPIIGAVVQGYIKTAYNPAQVRCHLSTLAARQSGNEEKPDSARARCRGTSKLLSKNPGIVIVKRHKDFSRVNSTELQANV